MEIKDLWETHWSDNGRCFGLLGKIGKDRGCLGMPFFYIKAPSAQSALEILQKRVRIVFGMNAKYIGFEGNSVMGDKCRPAFFGITKLADGKEIFAGYYYETLRVMEMATR